MGWSLAVRPASLVSGMKAIAPQLFYFSNWGANVFLQPYLAVLWRSLGFSGSQIGVLSFIRPMVAAPSGQLLAAAANARQLHLTILLSAFAAVVLCRSAMALASAFAVHALLVLDAAFGHRRLFASIGWGWLAPLTGWVVGRFGVHCNIYFYMAFALLAALPICLLPVDALGAKKVKAAGNGPGSTVEQVEEESGKPQMDDSSSSTGISSSSSTMPGPTPRRAQQAASKQQKTWSVLPLLKAGKGSFHSSVWGCGSTQHGSMGRAGSSSLQRTREEEAAGQWDLEAGHCSEEGSGRPKGAHSHDCSSGLTFQPHWGAHNTEPAAKWVIPAGREHLAAPRAYLPVTGDAGAGSQPGGPPAQLLPQRVLPAGPSSMEEEQMHSPFHAAAAAACPFAQEQEDSYAGRLASQGPLPSIGPAGLPLVVAAHALPSVPDVSICADRPWASAAPQPSTFAAPSSLASQGPLPSIDPAGLPEVIAAAACWEAQQLQLSESSGRLASGRAEGEGAEGWEQRGSEQRVAGQQAPEQQAAEQQGRDSSSSSSSTSAEAVEPLPRTAAGGLFGARLKPLLVPKRRHHHSSTNTPQPEGDGPSMGSTPPQRMHSVMVALLSGYHAAGPRPGGHAPGGAPRHPAACTLSMLGPRSARAFHGIRSSLQSFLSAGDVADIGLPEAASPHASLHGGQRLQLALGRVRPVGVAFPGSMTLTPGPTTAETAPAAISAAEHFAALLEAGGGSRVQGVGEPGATAGTPRGAVPASRHATLHRPEFRSHAGHRYSLQQPGSARCDTASAAMLGLDTSDGGSSLLSRQGGSSSKGGAWGALELDMPVVIRSPTARPFSPIGSGSGGNNSPGRELRRRASSRQVATPRTLGRLAAGLQQGGQEEARAVHAAAPAGSAGAPGMLLGLCMSANCLGEVLVFYFSGRWLARLGMERALNLAAAAYAVRLVAYTLLPLAGTLWWVLEVELLQGLTFAGMLSAATAHCKCSAAPHLRSTTQAVFSSLFFGVSPAISRLAGGYIYQAAGLRTVFVVGLGVMAAGWAAVAVGLRLAVKGVKGGRELATAQSGVV